jgi:hypothetical protein
MGSRRSRGQTYVDAKVAAAFVAGDALSARAALVSCLKATRRVRMGRDPVSGAVIYRVQADAAIRLAAAVRLLEWATGLPTRMGSTAP